MGVSDVNQPNLLIGSKLWSNIIATVRTCKSTRGGGAGLSCHGGKGKSILPLLRYLGVQGVLQHLTLLVLVETPSHYVCQQAPWPASPNRMDLWVEGFGFGFG